MKTRRLPAHVLALALLLPGAAVARPAPRPRVPPRTAKPAAPPAKRPAPAHRAEPAPLTTASLGAALRALGYIPKAEGQYQRIQVDEDQFGYSVDFSLSGSGAWLVCMAHLAPIEDLTKVPAAPLLSLLATNDSLLGMYFSYNRAGGQVMLNATVPNRSLTETSLRNLLEGLRRTVRDTQGLWDPARW